MKHNLKSYTIIFIIGIIFGITLIKSEAVSWFRIYEMFRFESFHMYGIIMVACILGILFTAILKKYKIKNIFKTDIPFKPKTKSYKRYLFGGIIFGLGWALVGCCPGPMFALLGYGFIIMLVVIFSAILGTFVYGIVKDKLPH